MKTKKQKTYKKVVFGMIFVIALSFFSYSYAITNTTFSISDMESKNIEIAELRTEIAELELEYFDTINDVSVLDAGIYGLEELQVVGYVSLEKDTHIAYNF